LFSFEADDTEHYLQVPIDDTESTDFKFYMEKIVNFIGKCGIFAYYQGLKQEFKILFNSLLSGEHLPLKR